VEGAFLALREKITKEFILQVIKFSIVGFIAFCIDYGTMVLLTEVFDVYYLFSTTISFIVSVIFNYIASMRYVFADKRTDLSTGVKFVVFVALSAVGLLINQVMMWAGVELIPWPADFYNHAYLLVKLFATAVVMVWNFVTRKLFYEKEPKPKDGASA